MDTSAITHAITSPGKGQDLLPPSHIVFPDRVNIRTADRVSEYRLLELPGFRGDVNAEGEVYGESARDHNLYVRAGSNGTLVSGSLRNWADAERLVPFDHPFGPDEVGITLDALDDRLGLPAGTLRRGRLSMVEGAVDLTLPRPVSLYVNACEDLPRTTPFRVGSTTVYFKTNESETKLYDKPAERVAAGSGVLGSTYVARFEYTLKSGGVSRVLKAYKGDGGVVRAGVLADARFRDDLAGLVLSKTRLLQFSRTAHPDCALATPSDREMWYAVHGIEAAGGLDAALLSVRAEVEAGDRSPSEAKAHLRSLRRLYRDPAYTAVSDLTAEFAAAISAASCAL